MTLNMQGGSGRRAQWRRGERPQKHLAGFTGILQCDCYSGFEPLFDQQRAVRPAAEGAADHAGLLLRPCAARILRIGRHRKKGPRWQEGQTDLPDRAGGGQAPRRTVRERCPGATFRAWS